ncbi:hypothetical protein PSA7680_02022 [Pseudoruegeria aquimaris]|uniref:Uncharacterized protein n=1 Tax=Pseudoruegeria aquimaris TaxID=393663 RepID=A0A1Y5SGV9_9RHOB|nr:hypothetical protein [Pseudoruegeria aquimaris]SLN40540.1 hypothetical protein PSA7680_02022 [Pseudoruegeria aquimaris]
MTHRTLSLALLPAAALLLASCSTPRERCLNAATQDLRTVDQLILETEANIERGFGLTTDYRITTGFDWCRDRWGRMYTCPTQRATPVTRPVAVDVNQEKAKLASLKQQRRRLAKEAEAPVAACNAQFPPEAAPAPPAKAG